jgi:PDZ domain
MNVRRQWVLWVLLVCCNAPGQDLAQLDRQTQALYHQISLGVIRAQLPLEQSVSLSLDPRLARWLPTLGPQIRALNPGMQYQLELIPATQPSTSGRSLRLIITPSPVNTISPNVMGLVMDDQGHAILPTYLPKEEISDQLIPVLLCDGTVTAAKFVGSDSLMNVTIVQVRHKGLRPMPLGSAPPPEGALAMSVPLDPSQVRLGVWTRWSSNWGIVVRSDGTAAGFSGRDHFVRAEACEAVALDLIQHGQVLRAQLGIKAHPIAPNDPLRLSEPVLGQMPGLLVIEVFRDTAAQRAGLQAGDVILSLAGQPVGDKASIAAAMVERNGPTELRILRQHQPISITVDLTAQGKASAPESRN